MSARRWAGVIGAVLAATVLAGCGGAPSASAPPAPPAPADQTVRESFTKLAEAGTATMTTDAATRAGGQAVDVPGKGEIDLRQRGYAFTVTLPGAGPLTVVGTGGVSYLQSEQLTSRVPGGKPWLLIDPVKLQAAGPAGRQFASSAQNTFGQLAIVRGASNDTRVVGPENVDGEQLTHYATTLDIARARQSAADPSEAGALDQYAQQVGTPTLPSEVWTDGQGRLRRLVLTIPPAGPRPAATATLGFGALGSPVTTIVAPPPDQTTDLAAAIAGG